MKRIVTAVALALASAATASAQEAPLAPWFDADGFYARPGADRARASGDMAACRVEAARLRTVRNTSTSVESGAAFTSTGAYDPVVAGAAVGIASIMFAIQDASYNGSIEQIEFRDCAVALGYRHYRLGERERARFNALPDQGFAALVAAPAPASGRYNDGETERNYFSADVTSTPFQNGEARAPEPAPAAIVAAVAPEGPIALTPPEGGDAAPAAQSAISLHPPAPAEAPAPTGPISRLTPGEVAAPQEGMAIVVASARQLSGAMQIMVAGDTFRFRRVTEDGAFLDLLQPAAAFGLRSHMNAERRQDPTLAGDFRAPRYSTFVIPAGRYVLSDVGTLNACLGALTFEARDGDVLYLGDFVLQPPNLPIAPLFNPLSNINSGMDNRLRADLRVAIADDLEGARAALHADETVKGRLTRAHYQNGYRIPCTGRYIGRVANAAWPLFSDTQPAQFHDAMAAAVAAAQ
ncbi:MAG: hypothetical protein ACREH4_02175 [Vitreimonas sp.]